MIIPGVVRRRRGCDRLIEKLAEAVFGVEVKAQEVVYRRRVFLTQRGFLAAGDGLTKPPPKPPFVQPQSGGSMPIL